jgi:hypothetical protein
VYLARHFFPTILFRLCSQLSFNARLSSYALLMALQIEIHRHHAANPHPNTGVAFRFYSVGATWKLCRYPHNDCRRVPCVGRQVQSAARTLWRNRRDSMHYHNDFLHVSHVRLVDLGHGDCFVQGILGRPALALTAGTYAIGLSQRIQFRKELAGQQCL